MPKPEEPYEPPRIEQVLTPEGLAREVLYAGNGISLGAEGLTE